ncbi:hypothetical protein PFNF135_02159 [Plasmodium falciparum NF135/5.C10]|uniref:Uncharacterized protein n=1 Tax=Plasmodium falciparum NF135/5.C10 TaxID=1036726 RepID=W4IJG9_PLAFA|nr:hypothetical protein PFNF135_02159 [Plasmodium falciparum NF135/5.C10]
MFNNNVLYPHIYFYVKEKDYYKLLYSYYYIIIENIIHIRKKKKKKDIINIYKIFPHICIIIIYFLKQNLHPLRTIKKEKKKKN